ncbi:MAG TPA: DHA2 family efflux MFS transporter permease subunit [Candidatus Paceibacterota bacterium]|nr:DHA2 family efflux MFS transporter permease subunit [Candidatus Paceibacterota bacterium]
MQAAQENGNLKWLILATVMVGTFLGRLDQTIVGLALPKIISDFSITVSAAGWIATAYILANAVFVPVWGKLGDTIGRKRVYILGFGIFIFGSALAGFSWDLDSMIVFRVIQAIASSADYPTAMAIIAFTFSEGRERAQALGIWSSVFAASAVVGPLLGGPLIDHLGWRWVFFINIPVGLVGLMLALAFIPESTGRKTESFDWWGAMFLGGALSALVLILDKGPDWGWLSGSALICYAATVIFGIIFYFIEIGHKEPIVDLKFFKNSVFVNTLLNNFIVFMGLMGAIFLIPIFAQTFLGYDATQTGYLFIPMAAALMLASPLGGALTGRVEARVVIIASTLVAALGLFLFAVLIDVRATAIDIMIPLMVMAFGLGFGMAQRTNAVASVVDTHEMGSASSVLALVRNISGAFGVAVFSTILNSATENNVLSIAQNSTLYVHSAAAMQQFIALIELKAQVDAYHTIFLVGMWTLIAGAIASLWLKIPEKKLLQPLHVDA